MEKEVVITVEHVDHSGVTRKVGDKARLYKGYTYRVIGHNETALVFEGEEKFIGTDDSYFS